MRPLTPLSKTLDLFLTVLVIKTKFLTMTPKVLYDLGPTFLPSPKSYPFSPTHSPSAAIDPCSLLKMCGPKSAILNQINCVYKEATYKPQVFQKPMERLRCQSMRKILF